MRGTCDGAARADNQLTSRLTSTESEQLTRAKKARKNIFIHSCLVENMRRSSRRRKSRARLCGFFASHILAAREKVFPLERQFYHRHRAIFSVFLTATLLREKPLWKKLAHKRLQPWHRHRISLRSLKGEKSRENRFSAVWKAENSLTKKSVGKRRQVTSTEMSFPPESGIRVRLRVESGSSRFPWKRPSPSSLPHAPHESDFFSFRDLFVKNRKSKCYKLFVPKHKSKRW